MKKRKLLSVLVCIVMLIGVFPFASFATDTLPTFSDMPNDWSTKALNNAIENGLLRGSDGKIMPNDNLTRAQMAAVIVRSFGANVKGDVSNFSDISASDWFAEDMAKAYQMQVIKGSNGQMNPNNLITRQEAFAILSRALKLQTAQSLNKTFDDVNDIADWAKGEVYAIVNAGYVQGSNGKLDPKSHITRSQFAQILDNIIKEYINTSSIITEVSDGNIMVNVPGVTLKDVTVNGDLIIGDGVGDGEVILDNVDVTGRLVVRGGGENSIIIRGTSDVSNVVVTRIDGVVSIKVEGEANVEVVYIEDGSDDVVLQGTIGTVEVRAADIAVTAQSANITTVEMNAANSKVIIEQNSTINNMSVLEGATDAKIEVLGTVSTITTNTSNTEISGTGTVTKVEAQTGATGAKIVTSNTQIVVQTGATGVTGAGDTTVSEGTTVSNNNSGTGTTQTTTSGGDGGDTQPSTQPVTQPVSAITVTGDAVVGETLTAAPTPSEATGNYQWQISDNGTDDWTNIGTNSNTYTIASGDEGKNIRVTFTASGSFTGTQISVNKGPVIGLFATPIDYEAPNGLLGVSNTVALFGTTFADAVTSENVANWTIDIGTTNLVVDSITKTGDTNVTIDYTLQVAGQGTGTGTVTIKAKAAALVGDLDTNETSIVIASIPPAYATTDVLANSIVSVANGTNEAGAIAELDATVGVVGTQSETGTATISWTIASYDGNTAGDYTATGVLTLPTGWTGTASDVTATVTVNPVTYTITYEDNGNTGGDVPTDSNEYEELESVTVLGNTGSLEKTGYTFAGWNTAANGSGTDYAADEIFSMGTTSLILYAQWTVNQYTITFNSNGGTAVADITQDYGTTVTAPATPTRTGYTFASWSPAVPATMPAENVTLTAQWTINQYTITFDSNGGTAVADITQDYGTAVAAPATPTRSGYTFASWSPTVPATMPAENVTLTAQWTINQYTLTFDSNGGTAVADITQDYGTAVAAPVTPTRAGYFFNGWYADSALTTVYNFGTMPAENKTIYVKWVAENFIVMFDAQGGTSFAGLLKLFDFPYGMGMDGTSPEPLPVPTRTGYDFAGWYTVASGGNLITDETPVTIANTHTIYAQWTPSTYTVTFNANGGADPSILSKSVTYDNIYGQLATTTRTGYTFNGWYTAASGGEVITENTTVATTNNHTLYAQWTVNQYTITFDSNGGSAVAGITQDYATAVTAPAIPTKTGYTFASWSPAVPATMPAENVTLTAQWNIREPSINPYPTNVDFSGNLIVGETLTGEYIYNANDDGYPESGTTFQWVRADSEDGFVAVNIPGATASTFVITSNLVGKYIGLRVTVRDNQGNVGVQEWLTVTFKGPVIIIE